MQSYFFPCLSIAPKFDAAVLEFGEMAVRRRMFRTSTFDLATLSTRHTLHLPYQLMDVYLMTCTAELEIRGAEHFEQALDRLEIYRFLFYVHGVEPFLVPFCTTYSVNEYSGINSRDSQTLREKLPAEMQNGLTSDAGTLEAWAVDMSLLVLRPSVVPWDLTPTICDRVASQFALWVQLEGKYPVLKLVRKMTIAAPMIPDLGSSILHVWQALESLFNVNGEIRFRLSLLISQLCAGIETPSTMYRHAKTAYDIRSKIAHGSVSKVMTRQEWFGTWWILTTCVRAVIGREGLPPEQDLFDELLDDN